jgi:hypothetical protein
MEESKMPTLREEMIATGLLKPQNTLHDKAVELERRYEPASTRLAEHDAKRKAAQEADLKKAAKPKTAFQSSKRAKKRNRDGSRVPLVNSPVTVRTTASRKDVEAPALPLTKREQRLLKRITQKNLSPEERQKAQRAFDHSRYLQELLKKREATNRLNRQAAKKKNRPKRAKFWISLPSKGSSMFGGVKYSYVHVCQGGLPGLGKRSY